MLVFIFKEFPNAMKAYESVNWCQLWCFGCAELEFIQCCSYLFSGYARSESSWERCQLSAIPGSPCWRLPSTLPSDHVAAKPAMPQSIRFASLRWDGRAGLSGGNPPLKNPPQSRKQRAENPHVSHVYSVGLTHRTPFFSRFAYWKTLNPQLKFLISSSLFTAYCSLLLLFL